MPSSQIDRFIRRNDQVSSGLLTQLPVNTEQLNRSRKESSGRAPKRSTVLQPELDSAKKFHYLSHKSIVLDRDHRKIPEFYRPWSESVPSSNWTSEEFERTHQSENVNWLSQSFTSALTLAVNGLDFQERNPDCEDDRNLKPELYKLNDILAITDNEQLEKSLSLKIIGAHRARAKTPDTPPPGPDPFKKRDTESDVIKVMQDKRNQKRGSVFGRRISQARLSNFGRVSIGNSKISEE